MQVQQLSRHAARVAQSASWPVGRRRRGWQQSAASLPLEWAIAPAALLHAAAAAQAGAGASEGRLLDACIGPDLQLLAQRYEVSSGREVCLITPANIDQVLDMYIDGGCSRVAGPEQHRATHKAASTCAQHACSCEGRAGVRRHQAARPWAAASARCGRASQPPPNPGAAGVAPCGPHARPPSHAHTLPAPPLQLARMGTPTGRECGRPP